MKKAKLFYVTAIAVMMLISTFGCSDNSQVKTTQTVFESIPAKTDESDEVFKIGFSGPMTGGSAESGLAIREGFEMKIIEINEAGGIKVDGTQKKIKILFEDAQSKPEVGISVSQKLITSDKVDILISDAFNSSVTMATMDLVKEHEIIITTVQNASAEISKKVKANPQDYKNFFKNCYDTTVYGETVSSFIADFNEEGKLNLANRKIAFVMEDTDFGRSCVNDVRESFLEMEGYKDIDFSEQEYLPIGHSDFYPQLNKLKKSMPDVVISCFTSPVSGATFVRQFKEIGLGVPCIAIYYGYRTDFIEQTADYDEGLIKCSGFNTDWEQYAPEVANNYQQLYGKTFSMDSAWAYDVASFLTQNIEKAGSAEPDKLRPVMLETKYKGFMGTYAYDPQTHAVKYGPDFLPVAFNQVQNGEDVTIWPESSKTSLSAEYDPQLWADPKLLNEIN